MNLSGFNQAGGKKSGVSKYDEIIVLKSMWNQIDLYIYININIYRICAQEIHNITKIKWVAVHVDFSKTELVLFYTNPTKPVSPYNQSYKADPHQKRSKYCM